ncbi:MAG: hypothetical protein ACYDAN_02465 [Candidatus Limnocylindrales bacterium]
MTPAKSSVRRSEWVRAWWTPERRQEAREKGRARWRAEHPEQAAIRDELLETCAPEPCDRCAAPEATMFVVDYEARTVLWRCRACAKEARASFGRHPETPTPEMRVAPQGRYA